MCFSAPANRQSNTLILTKRTHLADPCLGSEDPPGKATRHTLLLSPSLLGKTNKSTPFTSLRPQGNIILPSVGADSPARMLGFQRAHTAFWVMHVYCVCLMSAVCTRVLCVHECCVCMRTECVHACSVCVHE